MKTRRGSARRQRSPFPGSPFRRVRIHPARSMFLHPNSPGEDTNAFYAHSGSTRKPGQVRQQRNGGSRFALRASFFRLLAAQFYPAQAVGQVIKSIERGANGGPGTGDAKDDIVFRLDPVRENMIHEGHNMGSGRSVASFSQVVDDIILGTDLLPEMAVDLAGSVINGRLRGLVHNNVLKCIGREFGAL